MSILLNAYFLVRCYFEFFWKTTYNNNNRNIQLCILKK